MSRLIIVSNPGCPLPRDRAAQPAGLAVALRGRVLKRTDGLVVRLEAAESPGDGCGAAPDEVRGAWSMPRWTSGRVFDLYNTYCNSTLWPLFHYRLGLVEISRPAFGICR